MTKTKKSKDKLDVHVYFPREFGETLKEEAAKEQRTVAQFVRYLVMKNYEQQA